MRLFNQKNDYRILRNNKSSIEPEEIFFDAKIKTGLPGQDEDLAYSKMEVALGFKDFLPIAFFAAILGLVMLFYAFNIEFFKNDDFYAQAKNNSTRIKSVKAQRGIIYDRNMVPLVSNEPSFDLVAVPRDLPRDQNIIDDYAEKLHSLIGISQDEFKEKIGAMNKMSVLPTVLKENVDEDSAMILETNIGNFEGIRLEKNAVRDYKEASAFSHILGYTAKISEEDLKKKDGYLPTDYIGKIGIEQAYEEFLKGQNGEYSIQIDARHNILKESLDQKPEVGNNAVLSIDFELQKKAYELMEETRKKFGNNGAVFVAMDAKSGQILSAISSPGYDNNQFSRGISFDKYQKLTNDKLKPLFNRFLTGKYPSGSTIKPFLAAAALEEKIITPQRQILSTGGITIGNNPETAQTFSDWKEGGHGMVNMFQAIAQSVNTYFYTIGGGYYDIKGLGPERIEKYLKFFGFGNSLDVDISGESAGLVPTPDWKKDRMDENWYIGDTYNLSIGQGYLGVTPLQLVVATSAIANGGVLYKPRFVDKIIDSNGNTIKKYDPEIIKRDFIGGENINDVRKAMRETVLTGSARSLNALPVEIAGKTGTAQFGGEGKTHAWFTAFAPYDDPQIVMVILIEGGGEGSSTAVPIAGEIFQWMIDNNKLPRP